MVLEVTVKVLGLNFSGDRASRSKCSGCGVSGRSGVMVFGGESLGHRGRGWGAMVSALGLYRYG